jgi:putative membrane protein
LSPPLAIGLAVLGVAWVVLPFAPLPPFSAHMAMHMAVVAVAAPLLAAGLVGSARDPVARRPRLWSPIAASMVELVVVWAWHAPALHHLARHSLWARAIEQASFLAAGLYLWIAVLGGGAARRRERAIGGVIGLLLTSTHMTLLGALLALGDRPLFAHPSSHLLSPLHDQQLGGGIMLVVGGVAYLAGGCWIAARVLMPAREART